MPHSDPFAKFHEWMAEAEATAAERPERHDPGDCHGGRNSVGADRAAQGDRCARAGVLLEPAEPQGGRLGRRTASAGAALLSERAADAANASES